MITINNSNNVSTAAKAVLKWLAFRRSRPQNTADV